MLVKKYRKILKEIDKEFKKLKKFCKYIKQVFKFEEIIKAQRDSRKKRTHQTSVIFVILFWGFVFRIKSFNELEKKIKYGCFKPLFPKSTKMPSIDAITNVLTKWNINNLEESFQRILNTLCKNKQFKDGTIDGYTVCALDGTDIITNKKKKCKNCMYMRNGEDYRYVHKSVVAMTVGREINYVIKECSLNVLFEKTVNDKKTHKDIVITKSEGEFTGAMKLLPELPKWVDVIVADALYFKAPFIKASLCNSKDIIVRLKDKTSINYKLIDYVSTYNTHDDSFTHKENDKKYTVKYWFKDAVITDWNVLKHDEGRETPIRIYKFVEIVESSLRKEEKFEFREITVATTSKTMDVKTVWKSIHYRWYIENTCFHQLKTYSNITHCFTHDDTAIQVIIKIMFMAFNIFRSFLFKRLRNFKNEFKKKKATIAWACHEMYLSLTQLMLLIKTKIIDITYLDISIKNLN